MLISICSLPLTVDAETASQSSRAVAVAVPIVVVFIIVVVAVAVVIAAYYLLKSRNKKIGSWLLRVITHIQLPLIKMRCIWLGRRADKIKA